MIINRISKSNGKLYKVYSDERYLFSLYYNELKKYNIIEGEDVPDELVDNIINNVIFKRGKERALYLLEHRPYTIFSMKQKMLTCGYPGEVVDRIIDFLIEYNYLDDSEYVTMFVNSYCRNKSRRQIELALITKGIDRQFITDYFENNKYSDIDCFLSQYNKYTRDKDISDPVVRRKVFRYFYSKGFSTDLINDTMRNYAQ